MNLVSKFYVFRFVDEFWKVSLEGKEVLSFFPFHNGGILVAILCRGDVLYSILSVNIIWLSLLDLLHGTVSPEYKIHILSE